jgi:hypothetical protein
VTATSLCQPDGTLLSQVRTELAHGRKLLRPYSRPTFTTKSAHSCGAVRHSSNWQPSGGTADMLGCPPQAILSSKGEVYPIQRYRPEVVMPLSHRCASVKLAGAILVNDLLNFRLP